MLVNLSETYVRLLCVHYRMLNAKEVYLLLYSKALKTVSL